MVNSISILKEVDPNLVLMVIQMAICDPSKMLAQKCQCSENESENAGWNMLEKDYEIMNLKLFENKEAIMSLLTVILKDERKPNGTYIHPDFLYFLLIVGSGKTLLGSLFVSGCSV